MRSHLCRLAALSVGLTMFLPVMVGASGARTVPISVSRRIVSLLDGSGDPHHLEAEQVLLEARLALWMQNFARIPGSLFAQQWRAFLERRRETVLQ